MTEFGDRYDQPGQGYGGGPGYGGQPPQYGGPQYGGPTGQPGHGGPPPSGYQSGYPSGSTPLPTPSPRRTPADRLALVATLVTIVGYVCGGAGLLSFILLLTGSGDAALKFAAALQGLILGIGLGALNVAVGAWLTGRKTTT